MTAYEKRLRKAVRLLLHATANGRPADPRDWQMWEHAIEYAENTIRPRTVAAKATNDAESPRPAQ